MRKKEGSEVPRAQSSQDLRCKCCNACIAPGGNITCPRCKEPVPIAELSQEGKAVCPKCPEHGKKPKTLAIDGAILCRFCKSKTSLPKEKKKKMRLRREKTEKEKTEQQKEVEIVEADIVGKHEKPNYDYPPEDYARSSFTRLIYFPRYFLKVSYRGLTEDFEVTGDVYQRFPLGSKVYVALYRSGFLRGAYLERWCPAMLDVPNLTVLP